MFRFIPIVLLLQVFCLYHAYKNHAQQKWFWFIIFFPFFGSLLYLYDTFSHRISVDELEERVKGLVHSNYEIQKLEKALRFSETVTTKCTLADAYVDNGRYTEAIALYQSCIKDGNEDDVGIIKRLLRVHFLNKEYTAAIEYGDKIRGHKLFEKSDEKIAYARSLQYEGDLATAEAVFQEMDLRFINYKQRLDYCHFLIETDCKNEALEKLNDLLEEFELMEGREQRAKKKEYQAIKHLYASLSQKE